MKPAVGRFGVESALPKIGKKTEIDYQEDCCREPELVVSSDCPRLFLQLREYLLADVFVHWIDAICQ